MPSDWGASLHCPRSSASYLGLRAWLDGKLWLHSYSSQKSYKLRRIFSEYPLGSQTLYGNCWQCRGLECTGSRWRGSSARSRACFPRRSSKSSQGWFLFWAGPSCQEPPRTLRVSPTRRVRPPTWPTRPRWSPRSRTSRSPPPPCRWTGCPTGEERTASSGTNADGA